MKLEKGSRKDTLYNNGLTPEQNKIHNVRTANYTVRCEMRAQDSLPKILRDAVNDSSIIKWSSVTVVQLVKEIQKYRPMWSYKECVDFAAQQIRYKNDTVFKKECESRGLFVSPLKGVIIKKKGYLLC